MTLNLFIDTNIYLSFFRLTSDDLEELRKLSAILARRMVKLFLPEQVIDEFSRNRDSTVAAGMKELRGQHLGLVFPQMSKEYEEYKELRSLQKKYEQVHAGLLKRLAEDIGASRLKADALVTELFSGADVIPTFDLIDRARGRLDRGNPPGKKGSLGDAVNWEALIERVPAGEDLHFVTGDDDFTSPLDASEFNSFLLSEWAKRGGALIFYRRLSEFFKSQFPEIRLAIDAEKDLLIRELAGSWSFAATHEAVKKLGHHTEYSDEQANTIVAAALSNAQVNWILGDEDVRRLVEGVIGGREDRIDPENMDKLRSELSRIDEAEESEERELE